MTFTGAFEGSGSTLVLDRVGTAPGGAKQRLTLYPNANHIRYTLRIAEQEPGAPRFRTIIEVGVTKEGEAFAAGGAAANLPRCVVTGGAATLTVSYQGRTYPLCCTGCRDEFNADPEKYIKKAALRAAASPKPSARPASSVNRDDGAFDGLIDAPAPKSKTKSATPKAPAEDAASKAPAVSKSASEKPAVERAEARAARASVLLRVGQNLEKSGKTAAALGYYRRIVKDFAGTSAARTANARVKALSGR